MICFEQVKKVTTEEYFNGNQFSIDAFNKKYSQKIQGKNETYPQALKRVCDYIASAEETEELRQYWSDRWFDEIYDDWWHPAGSIMQGANSGRHISLANCSTVSLGAQEDTNWDNLESIIKNTAYSVAKMAAYRQGLGLDFSKIRPRGLGVKNSSNESQGAVHWMKLIDSIGNYIGQKGRIPAMLFSISIDHPDVEEFIKVKGNHTVIQNANISVQTNNAFYEAVEKDSDWELYFKIPGVKSGDRVYVDVHSVDMECIKDESGKFYRVAKKDREEEVITKKVKARYLLELIAKNMTANAEPGIQQIDMARYWSNSDYVYDPNDIYCSKIISSNACSEQYLSRDSLCVLASINVCRFDTNKDKYTEELKKIAYSINRFLDNVNTMEVVGNTYATPHQKLAIEKLRRTGAGVTNIAGWLFKQNLEYGSEDGNNAMFDFNQIYNFYLYESSISLGKEKGSFGLFVREKFEKSPFVQNMMAQGLVFEAMRNCTCSSIAPSGCIEENTRIITNKGLIKVKDLISAQEYPKEKSFKYDIDGNTAANEYGESKISAFFNNGIVNGYVIEFEDGRKIKTSETHRIRVFKNGNYEWEYVPNLNLGDIAILVKNSDVGPSEYVSLNIDKHSDHYNCSSYKLPLVFDEKLAEYIGLFTGDGSIKFRSDNGKGDAIRFPVFGEDEDIVTFIVDRTEKLFGVKSNISKKRITHNMYEVYSHSINIVDFIVKNGFSKKDYISKNTHTKEHVYNIPEMVFRSPKKVICAYLRGLFEADGSVFGKRGSVICFSSKHIGVCESVQELLNYLGIQSKIDKTERTGTSFGKHPIYRVTIRYLNDRMKFSNDIGFLSNRKNKLLSKQTDIKNIDREKIYFELTELKTYQKLLSKKIGSNNKLYRSLTSCISLSNNKTGHINRCLLNELSQHIQINTAFDVNNYLNLKIKNITRETFNTFDIEVENHEHTYITSNGVINHNTLSTMFRDFVMSYGVEPGFGIYYWKRTRISGKYEYYFCVPNVVRNLFKDKGYEIPIEADCVRDSWDGSVGAPIAKFIDDTAKKIGIKFKRSTEINAFDKLDLMSKLMKYVDSSISVTYSLPEGASWKDTANLIVEANKKGVKSIAVFQDKKMYGIVSYIPFKKLAFDLKAAGAEIYSANFSEEEAKELNLVTETRKLAENAPKRKTELESDIYQVSVKGKKYIMAVGIQDGAPYEMFGGQVPDSLSFKFTNKKGKMSKVKQHHYKLEIGDVIEINNFGEHFTASEQMLFRMISISLRYRIPIKFIVDQLNKAAEDVSDLSAAASRVLKKYIKDGEAAAGVCPDCGKSELIYSDGCVSCACGWDKGCG
jgi:ribonucleoside-diphosphate reductase alpha chain